MDVKWLSSLPEAVGGFLKKMRGPAGYFKYSLSGDIYGPDVFWGLGNTVFAAKIIRTLDIQAGFDLREMAVFIKKFQKPDGNIYDPLVIKKSALVNFINAISRADTANIFGRQVIRAETRQAFRALSLLGAKPDVPCREVPADTEKIKKYLQGLDWTKPWAAGSHFNHLLFFLKYHRDNFGLNPAAVDEAIDFALKYLISLQSSQDGFWYRGSPTLQEKINGAMKIILALKLVDRPAFRYAEKILDGCIEAASNRQACDNLNVVVVLKYTNDLLEGRYRQAQIKDFCQQRLQVYAKHYYPELGGFSFFLGKANYNYYGARITRGLNEPDIHATALFLWGISLLSRIGGLGLETRTAELLP